MFSALGYFHEIKRKIQKYRKEGPEIDQNTHMILEHDKGGNLIQWRKDGFCSLERVLPFLRNL